MVRHDPGECPICGAPHCSCGGGPIVVEQLPATAALRATAQSVEPPAELVQPIAADPPEPLTSERIQATLPPGSFTTANPYPDWVGDGHVRSTPGTIIDHDTYRGDPKKKSRP
jgi:hypothetical protein